MELNPLMKSFPPFIRFISVVPQKRGLLPDGQRTGIWARQGHSIPRILHPPPVTATMSSSEALARWPSPGRGRTVCNAALHPCSPRYLLDVGQNTVAIHKGVPRRDALIASQHLESGGFACSVEAKKAKAFPFADCQGDPVHCQQGLPAVIDLVETNAQATPVTTRSTHPRPRQGRQWLYWPVGTTAQLAAERSGRATLSSPW